MIIQHVLKGIPLPSDAEADQLLSDGILCAWWRRVGAISPPEVAQRLTPRNLHWHLSRFRDVDPATGRPFCEDTPYLSTTAGTVERDVRGARNLARPALLTALHFATAGFTTTGYVFDAYLFTLGKRAIALREFAEETRDLHLYTRWQRYHPEGEVVAKIDVPAVRVGGWACYDGPATRATLAAGRRPSPLRARRNPLYLPPAPFANVRQVTM